MKQTEHPHSVSLSPEEIVYFEQRAPYIQMYRLLRVYDMGVEMFEPDGQCAGKSGLHWLNILLEYFEGEEDYERCIYLHNWITEFRERWPHLK